MALSTSAIASPTTWAPPDDARTVNVQALGPIEALIERSQYARRSTQSARSTFPRRRSRTSPCACSSLSILERRGDYLDELGNVLLVLGRAQLDQERTQEALQAFAGGRMDAGAARLAVSRVAAWTAQGDAYRRLGEVAEAADLYRRAAEALEDFHF